MNFTPLDVHIVHAGENRPKYQASEMFFPQHLPITDATIIEDGTKGKKATITFIAKTPDGKLVMLETTAALAITVVQIAADLNIKNHGTPY